MKRTAGLKVNQRRMEELNRYIGRNRLVQWVEYENKYRSYNQPIKISNFLDELFDWHHIDKHYMIAVPRKLHRSIRHNLSNRESMDRINDEIEKWYKTNYNIEYDFKNKFLYIYL